MMNISQFNGLKMANYGTYCDDSDTKGRKVNRRIEPITNCSREPLAKFKIWFVSINIGAYDNLSVILMKHLNIRHPVTSL